MASWSWASRALKEITNKLNITTGVGNQYIWIGKKLFTITGSDRGFWSAVYSPEGKRIATSGDDGIVQIYAMLQIAESRVTRQLIAEEKEKYGVLDLN